MSLINLRDRTINAKIVYYGTGLSGKTTSLKHVHWVIDPEGRTELVSLNTQGDRTLFFDFLPIPLGTLSGFDVKLQAFTVPGQVKYNLTRRYVLRGVDGVIFVADSSPDVFQENVDSLATLRENLIANGLDPETTPLFVQYNKRDVEDPVPIEQLRAALNPGGVPDIATIATTGEGVFEGFAQLCCDMLARLAQEYRFAHPDEVRGQMSSRFAELLAARSAHASVADPAAAPRGGASLMDPRAQRSDDPRASIIEVATAKIDEGVPDIEELLESAVETNMKSARIMAELHETRRRLADNVEQLAALHETGLTISSELDSERLLTHVLERALQTVQTTHGSVVLWDREQDRLVEQLVCGFRHDPLVARGAAGSLILERVMMREPFVIVANEAPALLRPLEVDDPGPYAVMVAPLVHQGEVLGALTAYILSRPREDALQDRLRFLGAVATQSAVALENARLYARVETFNRELERMVAERTRELEQAYEELREVDALKDEFLASMSHELLTPLTSVSGFAEILAQTAGDSGERAESERREFATIVHREAERLTGMLKAVLDMSMLEAGRINLHLDSVDLRECLHAAYRRIRAALKARDIHVRVRMEPTMPPAMADARWLGRVFDELLSNACKFSPDGGSIHVTIRCEGVLAIVEIADEGPGVADELRATVFEKFKQLGDILTEKPDGLGLGLPMARLVVEHMAGRIWHAPSPEGGSVFGFALPAADTVAARA